MATGTLARLERILLVVPWLLDHPGATVGEVTLRFGLDRDELAADLDVLGYCGLPGYGGGDLVETAIVGDRVTVRLADFFRRPLTLSVREGVTLLLAARALAAVPGLAESDDLERAAKKLAGVLGVPAGLAIDLTGPGDEHLAVAREALDRNRVLRLRYRSRSKSQTTERDVEPWALVGAQGSWYLQGWCRLADAPRDFRLDRVEGAVVLEERSGAHPVQAPWPPAYAPQVDHTAVVLDLDRSVDWLRERLVVDAQEERGATRRLHLRTSSLEWVARLVLSLTPHVAVVAPAALAERVRELAAETLARYGPI